MAGMPTTAGVPVLRLPCPSAAPRRCERLEAAGALIVGKTNLDQFATGLVGHALAVRRVLERVRPARTCRAARAPARRWRWPTASSRSRWAPTRPAPAACRRRSTASSASSRPAGWSSTAGVVPACRSLDCVSVFAADVEGGRRALAVLAGSDPDGSVLAGAPPGERPPRAPPLRIGVPGRRRRSTGPPRQAWRRAVAAAADAGRRGRRGRPRAVPRRRPAALRRPVGGRALGRGGRDARARRARHRPRRAGDRPRRPALDGGRRLPRPQASLAALPARGRARPGPASTCCSSRPRRSIPPTTRSPPTRSASTRALGTFTTFANLLDLCAVAVPGRAAGRRPAVRRHAARPGLRRRARCSTSPRAGPPAGEDAVELVVCGAHLRGMPLNRQLLALGARFVRADRDGALLPAVRAARPEPRRPGPGAGGGRRGRSRSRSGG